MNLPAGVTQRQDLDVAPKSNPMSIEGLNALAAQKRREAEQMEAILARRQQEEQEERDRLATAAEKKRQDAEKKRQEEELERQKWAAINATARPAGHHVAVSVAGFDRMVIASELVVPRLVGDDLLIQPLGITLEVFTLESPVVDSTSAMLLEPLYLDEAHRRWVELMQDTAELMPGCPWLYTAALPSVVLVDAGPVNPQTDRPATTHKIVRATWGDCYCHNPIHHKGGE